ncbi:glutathione S-transferase family protein [Paroceanicella profunda]|uniref:Glutathione S-transferase family protein n=1 Tax=Paroceanicella profunda TaxID=2579971 RepID=A0A5B8FH01_9RHOB|nr:glutathione S-transferase family protein [Paroceanicella profunda]QDL91617.1 glutathione S-transferase family protein [Paroceanicella profunda]
MDYTLAIGDRTYSSWSLRGWLLFARFGLPVQVVSARLYTPGFAQMLEGFAPARLVPVMRGPEGTVWDSLAMAETLAEAFPDAGHWPRDRRARAMARSLAAEMHSGFTALRAACPMNLAEAVSGFVPDGGVLADLSRLETLWAAAGAATGRSEGEWLFGDYSVADAFFAPVAARVATYGLPVTPEARAYVDRYLADGAFRRWRAMGRAADPVQERYGTGLPERPWPGPVPLPAEAVTGETPLNETCPYSGKPVVPEALARIDGQVIGFCNTFCRDKTVADPEAWPEAMQLLGR